MTTLPSSCVLACRTRANPSACPERPTKKGGSQYSTLLSASGFSLAKYTNLIQIWGAAVKTALGLILAEPVYELAPFVPEVRASPAGKRQFSRDSHYRNRPRMRLLQEIAINGGTLFQGLSLHTNFSTNLPALGVGGVLIINLKTVRPYFVACFFVECFQFNDERFFL